MTMPSERFHDVSPPRLELRQCPVCRGERIFGEPGWRCCGTCDWDELPASRKAAAAAPR